jgi:hypothetical protein
MAAFRDADELTSRGMLKTVQVVPTDLRAFLAEFHTFVPDDIPFPGQTFDDQAAAMYAAIGDITGPAYDDVGGLAGVIGRTISGDVRNRKGALLELRVGHSIIDAGAAPADLLFQVSVNVPGGTTRVPDVVHRSPIGTSVTTTAGNVVTGVFHESKNWPGGLRGEGVNFGPLRDYADSEFPRDILLFAEDDFVGYHVDLRQVLADSGEADVVRDELLAKFSAPEIVAVLGEEAAFKREVFRDLWDSGTIVTFY